MRRFLYSFVFYCVLSIAPAQQGGVVVHNGFGDGQDYMEWSELRRSGYAMGVANGILLSPVFGAPKDKMKWFENCLEGMKDKQVGEILFQYVKAHPAEWHHGLHILSLQAFSNACPDAPTKWK